MQAFHALRTRLLAFWWKYEVVLGLSFAALGFTIDLFLAKRPDSVFDNILLIFYLMLSALCIVVLNARAMRRSENLHQAKPLLILLVLQFCFGGLAGNLLILYGKSGTLGGSLLFLALLLGFLLGNEFLKSRYDQLRFNLGVYYFLLLTYCIIAVPTFILHQIGVWPFVASGVLSLVVIGGFLTLLYHTIFLRAPTREFYETLAVVGSIFLIFNGLYFLNIIPPVPISLKDVGVYHTLTRLPPAQKLTDPLYQLSYEAPAWYVFWRDTSDTYTYVAGQKAYCVSAVFAPGALSTPIYHRWEKYDEATKQWSTRSLISFPINGGREDGYRGYSIMNSLSPGSWRCDIETGRGQLVGRISFTAVEAATPPTLSTTTL